MSKMYIVIGVPGCGKSTYIMNHSKEREVYNEFIKQINAAVASKCDIWVDQTSLNKASRKKLFNKINKKPKEIIAIYFNIPIDIALQRNTKRTGRALVPEDAIINMYNSLEKPSRDEGFTDILEVCD